MADGKIIIDTKIDTKGAEKGIDSLGGSLGGMAKTASKAFLGITTAAATGLTALGTMGVKYNSSMEQYMASFETMLGSADKAASHLNDLKTMAAKTPFELPDLAEASKLLLSFGMNINDIMPSLSMLGDISQGNKEKFNSLALAFAQIQSQGKLMGNDLLQLINAGFNPLQIISEQTGKSMSDLKKEMSDGKITYEMVAEAMKVATSEGGRFNGAMEKQSQTMAGMWSTLKDNFTSLIGEVFLPFSDVLKNTVLPALSALTEKAQESFSNGEMKASVEGLAESLGNLVIKVAEFTVEYLPQIMDGIAWLIDNIGTLSSIFIGFKAGKVAFTIAKGVLKAVAAFKEAGTVIGGFKIILTALGGPVVWVIGLIAGLVAGFIWLWNTNEDFRDAVTEIWNSIVEFFKWAVNSIVEFVTVTIPEAFNNMITWFSELPGKIADIFTSTLQKVYDWGNNMGTYISEFIPSLMEKIGTWWAELPFKIGEALGTTIQTVMDWGANTALFFTETVPKWINDIGVWFSELPGRILVWLIETNNKVIQWGKDMYNAAITTAKDFLNGIQEWFRELPGRIKESLSSAYQTVIQWGKDMFQAAYDAGADFGRGLMETITTLPQKMKEIGVDMIRGVLEGIKSAKDWLFGEVGGFFGDLVDGVKSKLRIHSPSRVFRDEIGAMMAQGVGVGFNDESKDIEGKMKKSIGDLTRNLTMVVDYETAKTTAGVVAQNNINSGNTNDTISKYNPSFNILAKVSVPLDGEAIAEYTTPMVVENISEEQNSYSKSRGGD